MIIYSLIKDEKSQEEEAKKISYLNKNKIADENRERYEKLREMQIKEKIQTDTQKEERLRLVRAFLFNNIE